MAGGAEVFILLLVAFIFPPAAVAFVVGCSGEFCLNILLTFLGYLPGLIHAFWLVLRFAEANQRYGYKNWSYMGMGEYAPVYARHSSGQYPGGSYVSAPGPSPPSPMSAAPPPPPGQQPVGPTPLPSQAPVDQKLGGYGYTAQAPVDQKSAEKPAPPNQGYGAYQGPSQVPADSVNVTPPVPPDRKTADSTAPPGST